MSNIQASADVSTVDPKEFPKYVGLFLSDVLRVVNGGLDFGTNISGKFITVGFTTANVDISTPHTLGRVPAGYIVTSVNGDLTVYTGSVSSTATTLVLRGTSVATATLFIF